MLSQLFGLCRGRILILISGHSRTTSRPSKSRMIRCEALAICQISELSRCVPWASHQTSTRPRDVFTRDGLVSRATVLLSPAKVHSQNTARVPSKTNPRLGCLPTDRVVVAPPSFPVSPFLPVLPPTSPLSLQCSITWQLSSNSHRTKTILRPMKVLSHVAEAGLGKVSSWTLRLVTCRGMDKVDLSYRCPQSQHCRRLACAMKD